MNQIVTLRQREPDLLGVAKLSVTGAVDVSRNKDGSPAVAITKLNGDVTASGLQIAGKRLGDVDLTAATVPASGSAPDLELKLRIEPHKRAHYRGRALETGRRLSRFRQGAVQQR